jgi:hypothetical protein
VTCFRVVFFRVAPCGIEFLSDVLSSWRATQNSLLYRMQLHCFATAVISVLALHVVSACSGVCWRSGSAAFAVLCTQTSRSIANFAHRNSRSICHLHTLLQLSPASPHYMSSLLAVWSAGGVAVPLSPSHPPAELRYAIEQSDARSR